MSQNGHIDTGNSAGNVSENNTIDTANSTTDATLESTIEQDRTVDNQSNDRNVCVGEYTADRATETGSVHRDDQSDRMHETDKLNVESEPTAERSNDSDTDMNPLTHDTEQPISERETLGRFDDTDLVNGVWSSARPIVHVENELHGVSPGVRRLRSSSLIKVSL